MIRRARLKSVSGHRAATRDEWQDLKVLVFRRARGRCEACHHRRAVDVHHVVKRSQGGSDDPDTNLIALCRGCHRRTDYAYVSGRLVIVPLGAGGFRSRIITKADKWTSDRQAEFSLPLGADGIR